MKTTRMKKLLAAVLTLAVALTMLLGSAITAFAEEQDYVTKDGNKFHLYYSGGAASVILESIGTNTQVVLPTSVSYGGVTYKVGDNGDYSIKASAFAGNTKVTSVAVPAGYEGLDSDTFKGCINLKKYYFGEGDFGDYFNLAGSGIGTDANGDPISGVTVYTKKDSKAWKAIEELNTSRPDGKKITLVDSTEMPSGGSSDGSSNTDTKGEDGTAYGKGASESVVEKAITKYAKETDPKGTVFGLLQARLYNAKKSSLTLKWTKVSGAKKYIVYGSKCGVKNKLVKQQKTTATKLVFKKVSKKAVKKGTYYKFVVVAFDKNGKVISTSKMVHAATLGGKVGNDKAVKTKAKKDKVSLKKGKTFKLAAKAVPAKKKLKVKKHRPVNYESSNKKIATVSAKGVIKGVKKGSCYVYAYAQNGVFKKIKVTVK